MQRDKSAEPPARRWPMARVTFLLGAGLISVALLIGVISYQYSFRMMERSYQSFYLNKAQMLVTVAEPFLKSNDQELLKFFDRYWEAAGNRPADEYICVVDKKGDLLLHTANPDTVGNYAGDNPILDSSHSNQGKLCDLVALQSNYVGRYISSAGHDQIAAFVNVPGKNWVLGVHRSRSVLHQEIEDGFRPFILGFTLVLGLLMPACLFLLYRTYNAAHSRQLLSQQALAESEERYQSLVDTMPQYLYRSDLQGQLVFANQALLDLWGVSMEDCQGLGIGEFMPQEAASRHLAEDVEIIRTGNTIDVVQEHRGPDGEVRYLEMVRHQVKDSEGRVIGVQGIFWDVTDKKLAEQKLECTMGQLDAVMQSVPSGILAVDSKGRLTLANQKAQELMGFQAKEAEGKPVTQFVPNSGLPEVLNRKKLEFGKHYHLGDKTFLVSRSPIYEGDRLTGAVSVFQDESELESVQRQLAEMKRLNDEFATLLENSHDGVLIAEPERIIKVNSSFGRITGLAPSSLEGKPLAELDTTAQESLALVLEVIATVVQRGSAITLRRKLQGENEIFITGTPVLDKAGQVLRVVANLRDVTELQTLEEQLKALSAGGLNLAACKPAPAQSSIVAESPTFKNVLDLAVRVSKVDSTVLLSGESGVGKDVLARLIHTLSNRREEPFIAINCGAIPENLLESELFGYEKGAFSGANRQGKPGLFEQANGGTVFLDEVGELPLNLQVKLLKVLQEHKARRVGGVDTIDLDIRVLAATNRDLKDMVKSGEFREDLFYRLYVVPLEVPPLRQRREDVLPLALRALKHYNKKYGVSRTLGQELLQVLESYDWPGNVRELENVVERMVVTADRDVLEPRHLPDSINQPAGNSDPVIWVPEGMTLQEARDHLEKLLIGRALSQTGNLREAAKTLGVSHPTVMRKAQKLGLPTTGEDARKRYH